MLFSDTQERFTAKEEINVGDLVCHLLRLFGTDDKASEEILTMVRQENSDRPKKVVLLLLWNPIFKFSSLCGLF